MSTHEKWTEATLIAVRDLTPKVREFALSYPTHLNVPPGSHVKVGVLIDGLPDYRSYSVVDTRNGNTAFIAVKLLESSRGGSRYMWSLKVGSRLQVTLPTSLFEPVYGASEYLLIAGGIGVTPIVSLCRALLREGAKVRVVYGARARAELAYLEELTHLLGRPPEVFVADEGFQLDIFGEIAGLQPDGQVYLCGPIGLMDAVRKEWASSGRQRTALRYETFGSSGHHASEAFTVSVPRLGIEVHVPANRSMLDALNDAGVVTLYDCRRGECGLCAVDIIEKDSTVDHRDVFLSDKQHAVNRKMCTCVSRLTGGTVTIEPAWRGDPDLSAAEVLQRPITVGLEETSVG